MTNPWDEFSKSLAQPVPRRESLRRLGAVFTATVLAPLGTGFARGGPPPKQPDPCKSFCKCRNKRQQDQCLKVCGGCGHDPSRLGGSCGNYFCCGAGQVSCGNYCADLGIDPYNCGACGYACEPPGPFEYGACRNGRCEYTCVEVAVDCGGYCTILAADPYNCGACGNVCDGPNPSCYQGTCSHCTPYCPEGWCGGDGCGGACGFCPSGYYCESDGWCYGDCPSGQSLCDGQCVDFSTDANNCGACGNVCGGSTPYCSQGACTDCVGAGGTLCNGACIDTNWDGLNCGACGNQCAPLEYCNWGSCEGACIGC